MFRRAKSQPILALLILPCVFMTTGRAVAQSDADYTAQTTVDPRVPIGELELLIKPLTKEELSVEADAWMLLLKNKVFEISERERAVLQKNNEIKKAEAQADQAAEAKAEVEKVAETQAAPVEGGKKAAAETEEKAAKEEVEQKAKEKEETLTTIVDLRDQRKKLIDRYNVVLAELKLKGGDIEKHQTYISAVSGIKIDVADASAAWVTIKGWLLSEEGGMRWLKNIGLFLGTLLAFWIVARIAGSAAQRAVKMMRGTSDLLRNFLVRSTRRVIVLVGLVVALGQLEINISPLLAAIGAAGFVVAFALQGTLSNFASGLLILIYRPYDIGDVVDVAGVSGTVESMSLMTTTIKTFDNKQVVVPNNSIWGNVITNVTGNSTRRVDMVFGIGYADDADKAQSILEDVITKHELVLKDPAPVVKLHELADSSVNLICRPWSLTADYWSVYWDVTRTVKKRFDAEGISIPFPQRDIHIYHENQPSNGAEAKDAVGAA